MNSTYLLIDTTLIGNVGNRPWLKKNRRPRWMAAIYGRDAAEVSPVVIDVARATSAARVAEMMALVNARHPQLGVSIIDTGLSLAELVSHLRQFIYVEDCDGQELTLRFADCAVLPWLASIASAEQWSALAAPINRWGVHQRDGKLALMPAALVSDRAACPLVFSDDQIAALNDAMKADSLLSSLRSARPNRAAEYASLQAYEYASKRAAYGLLQATATVRIFSCFCAGCSIPMADSCAFPGWTEFWRNPI